MLVRPTALAERSDRDDRRSADSAKSKSVSVPEMNASMPAGVLVKGE